MSRIVGALAAVVFSAIVAGVLTGYPGFSQPVSARSTADVAPIPAPTCPAHDWPYQNCANPAVRLITTDRLN